MSNGPGMTLITPEEMGSGRQRFPVIGMVQLAKQRLNAKDEHTGSDEYDSEDDE